MEASTRSDGMAASVSETIKTELFKYFGNKDHKELDDAFTVNCAYESTSNKLCSSSYLASLLTSNSWVIDSGATSHMCLTKCQIKDQQIL